MWGATPDPPASDFALSISIHAPRVGSDRGHDLHKVRHRAFQSTLPVWGATGLTPVLIYWVPISIHAPRVGSDLVYAAEGEDYDEFQSTLPVWGATVETVVDPEAIEFQSTLPVWGATGPLWQAVCCPQYFNPRSPCGERLGDGYQTSLVDHIFQSTLPVWGATALSISSLVLCTISIHAPRVGSDSKYAQKYTCAFVT